MSQPTDRNILAATFAEADGGTRAAGVLAGGLPGQVANSAIFVVEPSGRAKFVETNDWGPGRGALVGGAAGLIIGPLGMLDRH